MSDASEVSIPHVSLFSYPWAWQDEQGKAVTFAQWRGRELVVTAIYTSCRATCPRTIAKLRQLDAEFNRSGRAAEFVLVTLDPGTDSAEQLRHFKSAEALPDAWHLLTGGLEETAGLTDTLDIHVLDMGPHLVHDARIVIFDPQGMPRRSFSGWSLDHEAPVL